VGSEYLAEELHPEDGIQELYDEEDAREVGLARVRVSVRARV